MMNQKPIMITRDIVQNIVEMKIRTRDLSPKGTTERKINLIWTWVVHTNRITELKKWMIKKMGQSGWKILTSFQTRHVKNCNSCSLSSWKNNCAVRMLLTSRNHTAWMDRQTKAYSPIFQCTPKIQDRHQVIHLHHLLNNHKFMRVNLTI